MLIEKSKKALITRSAPLFLSVRAGMTVIVKHLPEAGQKWNKERWWMADVIHVEGGVCNPNLPAMFQVADVDSGVIRWVSAGLVTHIVPSV